MLPSEMARVELETLTLSSKDLRALRALGLFWLDEIAPLSNAELRATISPAGIKKLRAALVELQRQQQQPVAVTDAAGTVLAAYPEGELRKIAALRGTALGLGFDSPEALQEALASGSRPTTSGTSVPFGLADLAEAKLAAEQKRSVNLGSPPTAPSPSDLAQQIAERVAMYAKDYDTSTWVSTDWNSLRWLAGLEMRLENLQQAQNQAPSLMGTEQIFKIQTDEAARLIESITKLRDTLRISLHSRTEDTEAKDSAQIISELARNGKELLRNRAALLQHCGVWQGLALIQHPPRLLNKKVSVECAVCGKVIEWELVTKHMLELYTTQGSFIPADAPPGALDPQTRL